MPSFTSIRLAARNVTANMTRTTGLSKNETIGQFDHGLTGVNQPRNTLIKNMLWWSLGVLAMLILAIRIFERSKAQLRLMSTIAATPEQQSYWAKNRFGMWKLKKYLLYAPLWKKRHNREIRLSAAGNIGTIPSRLHTIILIAFGVSNFVYCCWLSYDIDDNFSLAADLRGRSGVLAILNMVPLIIFAGRNNPLIGLLQISFDTYNLFHRWIGRIVVVESVIHTFAWLYVALAASGWSGVFKKLSSDPFITFGALSTLCLVLILMGSLSPVRHAFYETFLNAHLIMAFIAIFGIVIHCQIAKLPQLPIVWILAALWLLDRLARMGRMIYLNYSRKGWTQASVQVLPGDACRVTMHLPRHVNIKPGTHAYLRFAGLNAWESHPFSIAWTKERPLKDADRTLPVMEKAPANLPTRTDVSIIIHAQTGLTKKLFDKANLCVPRTLTLKVAMEGPYAGHHSLDSFGHAVLFAGSSGITHQLPYVRHLIQGFSESRVSTRRVTLIWIIRDPEHLEWVRPWMDEILSMPRRHDILRVKVYITRPIEPKEIKSPSLTVEMFPGRPNIKELLQVEVAQQIGAMCVTVCGPGGLADNVREAVRDVQDSKSVSFIEESFTW